MIMDPERTHLAAEISEALLDVSVQQARPDVLDFAIALMTRESSFVDGMLDMSGAALVASHLAALLTERFYLAGALEDLAAALDLYGSHAEYLKAFPIALADRERAMFWWGYGKARQHKADVAGQRAELVGAAECLGWAADALDATSAFGRQIRGDLAVAQLELLKARGDGVRRGREHRERLEQTVGTLRALAETAGNEIERGRWSQNLATVLRQRSELWPAQDPRRHADLREALAATERGLHAQERAAPRVSEWDRVALLVSKADLLRELAGNRIDAEVEAAHVAAVDAARLSGHVDLLAVAGNWQRLLCNAGRWGDAATAGDAALSMLGKLVQAQPHQHYKQVYLRSGAHLAGATAFARVRAGDVDGALPTLERALAVIWRQRYLGPRRVASRLVGAGATELAQRYLALVAEARAVDASDAALRAAEEQLAQLAPAIEEVLGAEALDPVEANAPEARPALRSLHLVTSAVGSVALLRDPEGHVRSIELPDADPDTVHRMAARFRAEVVAAQATEEQAHAAIEEIVTWLEDAVLRPIEGPVAAMLARRAGAVGGADFRSARDVLTVVATGPFAGLPLHAARLRDGRPAATLGLAYAPALAALDDDIAHLDPATGVLVVADPASASDRLEGARHEREAIAALWPDAVVLSEDSATRSAVSAAIPAAALIHFACHGTSDDTEPLRSAVELADGGFTMRDVLSSPLRRGCVVVLSACQTAVNDPSVPDEAMSLAGGFLAAGAATVVASLWPIPDVATARLMRAFHERLRAGWPPAHALGLAQGEMAAALPTGGGDDWRRPYFWAGFATLGTPGMICAVTSP